jgi:hypothetical protein
MIGQTQLKVSYQSDQQRRYKMTRKHFIKLAEALRDAKADDLLIERIARVCEESNPNFDYWRFAQACKEADNG